MGELANITSGKSVISNQSHGAYAVLGSRGIIGHDDSYDYQGSFILIARVGAHAGHMYHYVGKVKISDNTIFLTSQMISFLYCRLLAFNLKQLSFGTGQPLIKANELKSLLLTVPPTSSEQERIVGFFCVLDDLIAAAKKKADLLKLKKRYYLQAIFSQHLRFKGFTKPWQQRKLGDVCKVSKNINKTQYSQSDVLSVSRDAGVVNQVQYQGRSFASNDLSRYRTVTPQSLIYTKSPLKVAPYGIMISSHVHGIVSPLYAVYQCPNNYNHFLSYFFSSSATLNNYLKPLVAKGAKNTINVSDCDAANGMVPYVNAEEVDAIVFIFQILDTLIEEVKDKHDLICRKKAFFLQKMFV